MQSCGHEHHDDHEHDHDHDGPDRGSEFSLFRYVDIENVRCLNEETSGSCKYLFKPWDERLNESNPVLSDADEQLILIVPFTGSMKLKSIAIYTGGMSTDVGSAPEKMKAFVNRDDIDFDSVEDIKCTQEWELVNPLTDGVEREVIEYRTKMTKFTGVRQLILFFPSNFSGGDVTRIDYIGFKGEFEEFKREPVVTLYELNANPADHPEVKADAFGGSHTIS